MANFLVIGGTGVMGSSAIKAIRQHFGNEANIIANWYGKEDPGFKVEGADHTLFGDITDPKCMDEIKSVSEKYQHMFYATALGQVGTPVKDATAELIAESNRLSFDPIPVLENELDIEEITAYSTFYVIKHQLCSYGAMAYSKEAIEKWTLESGKSKRSCIRAGLFESQSSRGIKLLLRKTAKKIDDIKDPLLRSYFEGVSSKEGIEKFTQGICDEEKEVYGDSPTRSENLLDSHMELFKADNPAFVNVCGKKIWLNNEPQLLKDYF